MNRDLLREQCIGFILSALQTADRNGMDARQTAEFVLDELEAEPARTHVAMHLEVKLSEANLIADLPDWLTAAETVDWVNEVQPTEEDEDEEGPALGEAD